MMVITMMVVMTKVVIVVVATMVMTVMVKIVDNCFVKYFMKFHKLEIFSINKVNLNIN
jgi:hypothetical protein